MRTTFVYCLLAVCLLGPTQVLASEVTGGLTSTGISHPASSEFGTLSGTVTSAPSGGGGGASSGGGGGGGNGIFSLIGSYAATPPVVREGAVLGVTSVQDVQRTQTPERTLVAESAAEAEAVDSGPTALALGPPDGVASADTLLAITTPESIGFVMETWMWLMLLLALAAIGYFAYSNTTRQA